ncbi:MAG: hypothetical protein KF841_08400 [Phycisphaerae bacterium]|nr:hypothetical protein [Phycisphaerae bacterium]
MEITDAGKRRFTKDEVLSLARRVKRIVAARGRGTIIIEIQKDHPSDADLLKLLLGPTGNLRAPTVLKGSTLLVGFNEGAYDSTFKGRSSGRSR